jgi:hypothetical protein
MGDAKAYLSVDEWLEERPNEYSPSRLEQMYEDFETDKWVREAWKQASRTARVQERILLGEMRKLKSEFDVLEEQYEELWKELSGDE